MKIPNLLTVGRLGLIPVFVLTFYLPVSWANEAQVLIFILAAITDGLDGFLARRLRQVSAFGTFLDPVADKLMVAVALVLLVESNPSPWLTIPAVIIVGREITVSALREWMAELGKGASVAVSTLGKVKTVGQMLALVLMLYREPIGPFPTYTVGLMLLYLAALLTLWSMVIYLRAAWSTLTSAQHR